MSVYFARVGRYVKVGYSENPAARVRNLFKSETRYARPLDCPTDPSERELLLVVPGGLNEERACHEALDDYAVGGEFFVDEPGVREFMTAAAAGRFPTMARPGGPALLNGYDETRDLSPTDRAHLIDVLSQIFRPASERGVA